MDLYPIQQLLKSQKGAKSAMLGAKINKHKSSPKPAKFRNSMEAELEALNASSNPRKRHDRAFTLAWAQKQDEKRINFNSLSPDSSKRLPVLSSPLAKSQGRRYIVQLATEKDQETFKMPLYQKDVFELRNENAKTLQQILSNKEEHQREMNKLSEDHRFKQFRSGSTIIDGPAPNLKSYEIETGNSRASLEFDSKRMEQRRESEVSPSSNFTGNLSSSWIASSPNLERNARRSLLEGLEELYYKDLNMQVKSSPKPKSNGIESIGKRKVIKKDFRTDLVNYRHYFQDDILMSRLNNPYSKNLPFDKPINGHIKDQRAQELGELEAKALVLRNIREIDESIEREVKNNLSLPSIKQAAIDDGTGSNYRSTTRKLTERQSFKSSVSKKDLSMKDLKVIANYIGKRY